MTVWRLPGRKALLIPLTVVAGWVDAVGYASPNHVFVANQTGNAVFVAVRLVARLAPGQAARLPGGVHASGPYVSIAGFCAGAIAAALLGRYQRRGRPADPADRSLLILEAVLLSAGVFIPEHQSIWLALGAAAMGVQSVYAAAVALSGVTTTTLTGTLVVLAANATRPTRAVARAGVVLMLVTLAAYVGGAVGGALAALEWSFHGAHFCAAAVLVGLALVSSTAMRTEGE